MSDVAPAVPAPVSSVPKRAARVPKVAAPKKEKKETKPKAAGVKKPTPAHPTYQVMIKKAIEALKEKNGSSKAAIFKYICSNFSVGDNQIQINSHLRQALKRQTTSGFLKQTSGSGASGSFRVAEKAAKKVAKKPVAVKPKKTAALKNEKKAPVAKKSVAKIPSPKKATGEKKTAKKPAIEKKAAKPKVAKATIKKTGKALGAKKVPTPKKMKAAPAKSVAKKPAAAKKAPKAAAAPAVKA
ncbi:hypothetical protein L596_014331 [Steinernema carpocapsae]|uniref:H15 domain-containing protein n=1 Tax=Steinernema carpocapsae TaxID=34508 RepID=A0A4V6A2R7_STECR|nr:hypothetical protein L596_014331 [Steinernema carpocapsae]